MALDAYIEFDGISGESLDEKHKNWIEILGYNFGTHQSASATASSLSAAHRQAGRR
jgi:type VI protein secretion system component Hcp